MKTIRYSIFVFLQVIALNAVSQKQNIKFEHLGTEQGLSQSNVLCILQDHRGFMWFGTRDGLNKYDGYKFTVYRSDIKDKNSLSSNFILNITEDNDGNLWIGTSGGGLNLFIADEEKFVRYRHDDINRNSIIGHYAYSLLLDSQGSLWVGTDKGLDLFNRKSKTFAHYTNEPGNSL